MKTEIRPVTNELELRQFVQFPFKLYKKHPYWVPPLNRTELATLRSSSNPVFEHSRAVYFTAWQNNEMVGRIAGIINDLETEHIDEKHARFGWLDFTDDPDVSEALINKVKDWAIFHNGKVLKGPYGFDQLDRTGMLTEGFDSLGTANTNYNYDYYPHHMEALGFQPDLKWVEMELKIAEHMPEKLQKFTELVRQRYGLTIYRPKDKADFIRLIDKLFDLILDTYKNLPGFVPISEKQRLAYIERFSRFLRMDFVQVVLDEAGEPIAFGVSLPSFSHTLQKVKGRLFPFGFLHLLKARRWNDTAELALIGVKEDWRRKGPHGVVFLEQGKVFITKNIHRLKINPMLENNMHVLTLWKDFEHRIYKRRQTYKMPLGI